MSNSNYPPGVTGNEPYFTEDPNGEEFLTPAEQDEQAAELAGEHEHECWFCGKPTPCPFPTECNADDEVSMRRAALRSHNQ